MNGCSKKFCPMQAGTTNNCTLTKKECPYYTPSENINKIFFYIKYLIASEIFWEIDKLLEILKMENGEKAVSIDYEKYLEFKKKYQIEMEGNDSEHTK